MAYFEMTIINGNERNDFNISVNNKLYNYLTCHPNQHSGGEDWFDIKLNQSDVENIQKLCKTNEEKQLISNRAILIGGE